MKTWLRSVMPAIAVALPVGLAVLVCGPVWAELTDGHVSEMLSRQMYCSVGGLLEGDIGLLAGLVLVFIGIWGMVQGAKIVAVLPVIIIGSLVTALPSLIESSFTGLGVLLVEAKISTVSKDSKDNSAFAAPNCDDNGTNLTNDQLKQIQQMEDKTRKIDRGNYGPGYIDGVLMNSSGSPDDRDAKNNP